MARRRPTSRTSRSTAARISTPRSHSRSRRRAALPTRSASARAWPGSCMAPHTTPTRRMRLLRELELHAYGDGSRPATAWPLRNHAERGAADDGFRQISGPALPGRRELRREPAGWHRADVLPAPARSAAPIPTGRWTAPAGGWSMRTGHRADPPAPGSAAIRRAQATISSTATDASTSTAASGRSSTIRTIPRPPSRGSRRKRSSTSPTWNEQFDPPPRRSMSLGEVWARGAAIQLPRLRGPRALPQQRPDDGDSGDFAPVEAGGGVCDGTNRTQPADGKLAEINVTTLEVLFPPGTNFTGPEPVPTKSTATDGRIRRPAVSSSRSSSRPGWPAGAPRQ